MQTEFYDTLAEAVAAAFVKAQCDIDDEHIEAASHLMAQRRVSSDGDVTWAVEFSDRFDNPWMTHLFSTTAETQGGEDQIVEKIKLVWDEDWDQVQVDRPVGDFSMSSSDFVTRCVVDE